MKAPQYFKTEMVSALRNLEAVVEQNLDWEVKYDLVFQYHKGHVKPLLEEYGVGFEWYDPDTGYEEDVMAYVSALKENFNIHW